MGLQINNNIAAFNSYRNLSVNQGSMEKSLEKLSSGFRINRAADDAAGLAISEGLRSQVGGLKQAVRNAQDGISVVQTAEGALTEVTAILQRGRDLQVQAANGSNNTDSLAAINAELTALSEEITAIGVRTNFNGVAAPGRHREPGLPDRCALRRDPDRRHERHRPGGGLGRPDHGRGRQRHGGRHRADRPDQRARSPRSPPPAVTSVPRRTGSSPPSSRSTSRSRT